MDKHHKTLRTIARSLSEVENQNIGLISGKMGAVIFFFHYARYTGEKGYEDTAMEFLDEVQYQLSNSTETSYRHGVAGIGIGIDYLIENGFISADENLLDDFDLTLYRASLYDSVTDYSLYDGLTGYGWYWLSRMYKKSKPSEPIFNEILYSIQNNFNKLSITSRFDMYNFLIELSCLSGFGKNVSYMLRNFRKLIHPYEPGLFYPRLNNSPAGELARTYLLKKYWQFDDYIPSPLAREKNVFDSKMLAWDGLYLLFVLSPKEKAWIGLL